jgi:hypothetical protein
MSQLGAKKKKTVAALCLIAVMVLMWVRVFAKKTPPSAEASLMAQAANLNSSAANPQVRISFIELPKVGGRNDVLTRDFFAANSWQGFLRSGEALTGVKEGNVSKDGSEELVRRIADKLKLQAIGVVGENPQAFINNKVLSVGDKLLVTDGVSAYECEVVGIEEDTVFVKFGEAEIQLRLAQGAETTIER